MKTAISTIISIVFILSMVIPALGQEDDPPVPFGEHVRFKHLTSEDGLSSDRVDFILQDSRGFMWIGTQDGLNRYDGNEFRVFKHKPDDKNSLSGNFIWIIFEDQDGTLWVGTFGAGLNRYDPKTERFTRYNYDPEDPHSLSNDTVYAIHQDRHGSLWVGTSDGLNRYEPDIDGFTRYQHDPGDPQSLSHNIIWSISEDVEGMMWIGTDGGGLNRFDPQTERFFAYRHNPDDPSSLVLDSVKVIYQDDGGTLWLGTREGGLDRLDFDKEGGKAPRFTHYRNDPGDPASLSHDNVSGIYEDKTGDLWISTLGGGLNRFDRITEQFSRFQANPNDPYSLSHNSIFRMLGDPTGLLWLGTVGGGVNILDLEAKAFNHIYGIPGDTSTLNSNDVMGIYEDPAGVLWIGTGSGGLNKIDPQTQQVTHYQHDPAEPESISHNEVREIVQDSQGMLWLPTRHGLNRFNPATGKATTYLHDPDDPSSLIHNLLYTVFRAKDGMIWVGTRAGLNRLDPLTGEFLAFPKYQKLDTSLSDIPLTSIDQDETGVFWMGTAGGGLIRFDPQTELFTQYKHNPDDPASLVDNFIWNIFVDRTGKLWIGTAAGLNRFDSDTSSFIHFTEKDGFTAGGVMSILQDDLPAEAGGPYLWISTKAGLTRFNPDSGAVRNYDVSDGLQGDDFGWSSAFKNQQGELFFGGTNGLTVFNPSQIKDNPHVPQVAITDFQLADKSVEISEDSVLKQAIQETDQLVLSYQDRVISFEFSALDYRAPAKNRYQYILEGFDKDWTEVGSDRRFVTYTNLDPGEYVFRVLGSNNDGVWNEQGATIAITFTPPWWSTTWAYGVFLALGIAGLYGAYHWRVRSLQSRTRELEDLVAEQTHQLNHRVRELDTLLTVSQELTSTLDLEPLLNLILSELRNAVDYDVATIRRLFQGTMELQAYRWMFPGTGQPSQSLPAVEIPIIQKMIQTKRVILVDDHQMNPVIFGEALNNGEFTGDVLKLSRTLMCVPLIVKDEVIGMLVLGHHQPNHWVEETKDLVQAFANQAAVAIVNAELFEKAGEAATLEERNRLARELHDSATQSLYSATLFSEAGRDLAQAGDLESAEYYLSRVGQVVHQALKDLRLLVFQLRPPILEQEGLAGAIQKRLDAVEKRAGVETRLIGDLMVSLPDQVSEELYFITMEALNNALKHANADMTTVSFRSDGTTLVIEIVDTGGGFDLENIGDSGGMGLKGMRERVVRIGSDLVLESALEQGTRVIVTVPVTWADANIPDNTKSLP